LEPQEFKATSDQKRLARIIRGQPTRILLSWVLALLLPLFFFLLARRFNRIETPRQFSPSARQPQLLPSSLRDFRGISLLEYLSQARFETPDLKDAQHRLRRSHWRSFRPPFAPHADHRAVQFVAITTSQIEQQTPPAEMGANWAPDIRTWNSAQGSYDGREALLAPPNSRITFSLYLPSKARLRLSPAVVGPMYGSVTFEASIQTRNNEPTIISSYVVTASQQPAWHDLEIDLEPYGDQHVELELRTQSNAAGDPPSALWGDPVLVVPHTTDVPYNIVWIVVDALRPDFMSTWHTEARKHWKEQARLDPLEAWLPALPSVAPHLEAIAKAGTAFIDTTSAASWTRPGTLAMLTGTFVTELGLDATPWILSAHDTEQFYASRPPLLANTLRAVGVTTQAIVNNYFLTGYSLAGIDTGFASMIDHRSDLYDTKRITHDATKWLDKHAKERFFLFLNFNSPHYPYTPESVYLNQVPLAPLGPKEPMVRNYLGEIAKDDEAIGTVLEKLSSLDLTKKTLVIVTSDHGETLSSAHEILSPPIDGLRRPMRFHHANAMYEETVRVPLLFSLPERLPTDVSVATPAQTIDIVPTILEIEKLPADPKMSGHSLLPFMQAQGLADPERPIFTEGRAARSLRVNRWRYIERDSIEKTTAGGRIRVRVPDELYDLSQDPGERHNVAKEQPDDLTRMREKMAEALRKSRSAEARRSSSLAGSRVVLAPDTSSFVWLRVRFASAGQKRSYGFSLSAWGEKKSEENRIIFDVLPIRLDPQTITHNATSVDAMVTIGADEIAGFDIKLKAESLPLRWDLSLDHQPLPAALVHGGPYGLSLPALLFGIQDTDVRQMIVASQVPEINVHHDVGVFVVLDRGVDLPNREAAVTDEASKEVGTLLKTWGYAAPSPGTP